MTIKCPKVSVVCAWFNRADYIRDTIDSLLAQDYSDFEIVVVNDGSTDQRVREILDSYSDPRLRIIHGENRGFTQAISFAIEQSTGEYIAIQGAGDVSLPMRLSMQAAALDNDITLVAVSSQRRNVIASEGGFTFLSETVHDMSRLHRDDFLQHIGSPVNHGEISFRKSVYYQVGGYRSIFRFSQDMDLWLRMTEHGDFGVLDSVLFERRIFEDGVKGNLLKTISQLKYSRLAKQCARERDMYGSDTIEMLGADALLYRATNKESSIDLAKGAIKYSRAGLRREARYLANCSWNERVGLYPALAILIVWLDASIWSNKLSRRLLSLLPIKDWSSTSRFVGKEGKNR